MGTNQQLTFEQQTLLSIIYDIEKNDDDITIDRFATVIGCVDDISIQDNITLCYKIKKKIKNLIIKSKNTSEKKDKHLMKREYDFKRWLDNLEILNEYGYINDEYYLTTEGKQRALLFKEQFKNKNKHKWMNLFTLFEIGGKLTGVDLNIVKHMLVVLRKNKQQ